MSNYQKRSRDQRQQLVEEILKVISEGDLRWEQCWSPGVLSPFNPVSKTRYKGVNRLWLGLIASAKGYEDPRWLTFNQIKKHGYKLKKGTKGSHVEKWGLKTVEVDKDRDNKEDGKDQKSYYALQAIYTVFNAECIEGIEKQEMNTSSGDSKALTAADGLISTLEATYLERESDYCAYFPTKDTIVLAERKRFDTAEDFLATLCHEAAHSTGHDSRLARPLLSDFGSEERAKEELIAELSALFMQSYFGMDRFGQVFNNSAAYLEGWAKGVGEISQALFSALTFAEKASDYLTERYEQKSSLLAHAS